MAKIDYQVGQVYNIPKSTIDFEYDGNTITEATVKLPGGKKRPMNPGEANAQLVNNAMYQATQSAKAKTQELADQLAGMHFTYTSNFSTSIKIHGMPAVDKVVAVAKGSVTFENFGTIKLKK